MQVTIYFKILIFLPFHFNIFFPSYISLLQTVISTCLTQKYREEMLDSYKFSSTSIKFITVSERDL